ncbi:hypothetical protein [Paraclostridium bifermentans]|nr:hypothetical protein [Paraclostridium bifermentans]
MKEEFEEEFEEDWHATQEILGLKSMVVIMVGLFAIILISQFLNISITFK